MIYELRIYRCVPGRKPALLSRFENETLRIWEKHGIRQVGFWTTLIGKSSLSLDYVIRLDFIDPRVGARPRRRSERALPFGYRWTDGLETCEGGAKPRSTHVS